MSALRDIQQAFAKSMVGGDHKTVAGELCPIGSSPLRMLTLYRRMIRNNYLQVLKVTYPVLNRLVGKSYFHAVAMGYVQFHPSTSGDLFSYGRFLPALLEELDVSPWLAEVAKLEWACHEVYQATDAPVLSCEQLQTITSADPSRITVQFHPASRLLCFPHPVHRVWRALQPDAPAEEVVDLPLPEEASGMLVTRPFQKVRVSPVGITRYPLLEALFSGEDLSSVSQMAMAFDPEFDLSRFLLDLLNQQIVIGISIRDSS